MDWSTWGDFYEDVPVQVLAAIRAAVEKYERERQAKPTAKEPEDDPVLRASLHGLAREAGQHNPLPTPSDTEIVDRLIALGKDPRAWRGVINDIATLYKDAVRGRREREGEPTYRGTLTSKQVVEELVYAWERGMEGATINWGAIIENARRALAAEGGGK